MRIILSVFVLLISATFCCESANAQGRDRGHHHSDAHSRSSQHTHPIVDQHHPRRRHVGPSRHQQVRPVRHAAAVEDGFLPEPRSALINAVPKLNIDAVRSGDQSPMQWSNTVEEKRHIPFVNGDIFGVSRYECCDEWKGLFQCLDLTNTRSPCECPGNQGVRFRATNSPGAEYFGQPANHRYQYDSPTVVQRPQTARRTTVSEYFHPQR